MNKIPRIAYFFIGLFVFVTFIVLVLFLIPNTIIPIIISIALAYAFDPLIDYFEEKGIKRQRVVFWFFILLFSLFLLTITIVIPFLFIQLSELIENIPSVTIKLLDWISLKLGMESSSLKINFTNFVKQQYSSENVTKIANFFKLWFSSTANIIFSFLSALIIPVLFYYFLINIDPIKQHIFNFIPKKYQPFAKKRLMQFDIILNGFIRGQLMVAMSLGILYSIGLMITGVKYGLIIGILSGFLNFIPYLGVSIGIVTSSLFAFFGPDTLFQMIGILLTFGIIQTLEGFVITPKIVGDKVGISPFAAIVSLLVFGELFGLSGMLLAIPLGGIFRIIYRDLKAAYLKSDFYKK